MPDGVCRERQAIGEAVEMIRGGDADVMLAGGTHSMIHPLGLTGFVLLTAMSTRNDDPRGRAGRSTGIATVSSSVRGAGCSSWRSSSMPGPAVRSSTARSPATARRPTPSA